MCNCGRCTCDKESDYRGPTCEDCPVSTIWLNIDDDGHVYDDRGTQ